MKIQFAFAAALAALLQSACVASSSPSTCSFSGEKYLPQGMTASEVCSAFSDRLDKAIGDRGEMTVREDLVLALTLDARGSIEAQVSMRDADHSEKLPNVAVDVMDRTIEQKDFDRLADTLAEILTK